MESSRKSEKLGERKEGRETEGGESCLFVLVFDGFHGMNISTPFKKKTSKGKPKA